MEIIHLPRQGGKTTLLAKAAIERRGIVVVATEWQRAEVIRAWPALARRTVTFAGLDAIRGGFPADTPLFIDNVEQVLAAAVRYIHPIAAIAATSEPLAPETASVSIAPPKIGQIVFLGVENDPLPHKAVVTALYRNRLCIDCTVLARGDGEGENYRELWHRTIQARLPNRHYWTWGDEPYTDDGEEAP